MIRHSRWQAAWLACSLLAAPCALASDDASATAGLAGLAAAPVGLIGGAITGWFAQRFWRAYTLEVAVVGVITGLILALARPLPVGDLIGLSVMAAFVSLIPLLIFHTPTYWITRTISTRAKNIPRASKMPDTSPVAPAPRQSDAPAKDKEFTGNVPGE